MLRPAVELKAPGIPLCIGVNCRLGRITAKAASAAGSGQPGIKSGPAALPVQIAVLSNQ